MCVCVCVCSRCVKVARFESIISYVRGVHLLSRVVEVVGVGAGGRWRG